MNKYAQRELIIEPMKIVGNDWVGKSLTLQFYSSIKLEGFYKLYFNLKLFEHYGLKNYFFIELMRGFLTKEKDKIIDDISNYMNCVEYMQNKKNLDDAKFFDVLKELINYLKINENKYIIIIDQFKYEYITDMDFKRFQNKIDKGKFRLIICCLNDVEVKDKMFQDFKEDVLWINSQPSEEEKQPEEIKTL